MSTKISDLIEPGTIEHIKELNEEMKRLLATYTGVALDLAKGLEINVKVVGDIDRLENLLVEKSRAAITVNEQLSQVMAEQSRVIGNTTNTISRSLMEKERDNKVTREAYAEQEKVKSMLDMVNDTYKHQSIRLLELEDNLKKGKKELKSLGDQIAANGGKNQAQLDQYAELSKQTRLWAQEKANLTQIMKAEEKAMLAGEDSYAEMSQHLELLKKAYKNMSAELKDSDFGREMEQTIQNLDAHLKDLAADMGEFQRNVGNYAIAGNDLKKKYDDLVGTLASLQAAYGRLSAAEQSGEEGRKLAASIDEVSAAAKEMQRNIEEHNRALEEARRSLGETGSTTSSVKRDLKELVLEIANLTIEYQKLSAEEQASAEGQALAGHIRDLTEQAGVLKDAIADTNAAITNAASDTRTFDQMGGAIQLAIDGFGLAQGAAAALGISEGELAEIQTKLQAAIAASNAMQSIQNTLQSQSAVMQGVNLVQTKLRTAAERAHTAAQGKGVVVTKAATVAQWAFNAAANANPIGLLVAGVVLAAGAVWGLVKAFDAFIGPSDEANKQIEAQIEKINQLKQANEDMIKVMEASGASSAVISAQRLQDTDELIKHQAQLVERMLQEKTSSEELEAHKGELKRLTDEQCQQYNELYAGLTTLISEQNNLELKEKSGAALKKKLLNEEIESQKMLIEQLRATGILYGWHTEKLDDALAALEKKRANALKEINKEAFNESQSLMKDLQSAVRKGEDDMLKLIADSAERKIATENVAYKRKIEDLQNEIKVTRATKKNAAQIIKAINVQIEAAERLHQNNLEAIALESGQRRYNIEVAFNQLKLDALRETSEKEIRLAGELRLQALSLSQRKELLELQKNINEGVISEEEAQERRTLIAEKYALLREQQEEDTATKIAELIQKRYADAQADRDNALAAELLSLQQSYAKQLEAVGSNEQKRAELKERYDAEAAAISERYAVASAKAAVDLLEETLKTENLSAEDRDRIARELAAAKIAYEKSVADATDAANERQVESDTKALEKRKANLDSWLSAASDSIGAISDLVDALYDGQIQDIEAQQEANDKAGEEEQERIARLVESNVITEEEGEARKRAAEDRTAKKKEELEKKKAEIQRKQAIFQKATDLAQAGIATALAITQALPNFVMAALVGALGAIQIATIVATPIPQYAKGTENHRGGPAIVGDGGRPEVVLYKDIAWITPDTPTLVDLPAGASVIPSLPEYEIVSERIMQPSTSSPVVFPAKPYDDKAVRRGISELVTVLRRHTRVQLALSKKADYSSFKHTDQ